MKVKSFILFFLLLFSPMWLSAGDEKETANAEDKLIIQKGTASYYGSKFHLRKTANGEIFNMEKMTAAHQNLPFGTRVKVTNLKNGKVVWVRINDRLPQNSKRIIDLSKAAASKLEMVQDGLAKVQLEVPDEDTIFSLIEYYDDNKPENIRLRIYELPIEIESEKPDLSFPELEIPLPYQLIAGI